MVDYPDLIRLTYLLYAGSSTIAGVWFDKPDANAQEFIFSFVGKEFEKYLARFVRMAVED